METISKQPVRHASALPEGTPLFAKSQLHFGNRAAVDQALSRLVQPRVLLLAGRGISVRPVESRFGTRAPSAVTMAHGLATELTSGPSRSLKLGAQTVEFVIRRNGS